MQKIRLGKSEMAVTRIGFGGIPIQRLNEEESIRVVRVALDAGINWIDTAHGYSSSEERVGRAIKGYTRGELFIFTKGPGRDPKTIREQIELSLKRLDISYIDLYQFHIVPSREVWGKMKENGTRETVRRLRDEGIIRHIGASAHTEEAALAVLEDREIEVLQYPFNFIVENEGKVILEKCRKRDIGFIAMKPFAGGVLGSASPCIRFLLQFEDLVTDPGFERSAEVEEVAALSRENKPLSDQDRRIIHQLREELGSHFCRRCGYCTPCAHGVQIIPLMTMDSIVKRFPMEFLKSGWTREAAISAEKCSECGECEEKCPYQLPIMEQIRRGAEILERVIS